jgi:hypothetical protein
VALGTTLAGTALAGCGFVGASSVGHNKPDAFILRGEVTVPVPPGDARPDGAACAATVPDIVAGTPVRVTDPDGHPLGSGVLGDGMINRSPTGSSCDFAFQIPGVTGGVASYDVAVGTRPAKRFPAKELRENATAVIPITA